MSLIKKELDYITVEGFRSIRSIQRFAINPINIVIGANGAGKSNFINAFSFLHEIREGRLQNYVRTSGGAEAILHFGTKNTQRIVFELSFADGMNSYELSLTPSVEDTLVVDREVALFWDKSRGYNSPYRDFLSAPDGGKEAKISNQDVVRVADWVRHRLGRWRVYHLHDTSESSAMRKTCQTNDNEFLRDDASNLPAFLFLLQNKYPSCYNSIVAAIQQVAPFFEDFTLKPDNLNSDFIRLTWKHRDSERYFGAAALSDGTLRFMALATLFLQPNELKPSVTIVDEPELGLHPYAIEVLANIVQVASRHTQVIMSTQSPQLLDPFDPIDIVVAESEGGGTTLKRLDPNQLSTWLETYGLGQLWEKNYLGGRPRWRE